MGIINAKPGIISIILISSIAEITCTVITAAVLDMSMSDCMHVTAFIAKDFQQNSKKKK